MSSGFAQKTELPSDRPITIMPLGDSITEGGSFSVYRYPLMEKLVASGYAVKYLGSKETFSLEHSPLGKLPHEGYAGKNVAFLAGKFGELYRRNPADIVLIHAGHNQSSEQMPVHGMLRDTKSIIETARLINPEVVILLAQVIPSGKLPKYSYIPEYNAAIADLAAELDTLGQRVILVNQADGFHWQTDTIEDYVHPSSAGAEKMAGRWFEALNRILPAPGTS